MKKSPPKNFIEYAARNRNIININLKNIEHPVSSYDDIYERGRKKKILREISPGQYQEVTLIETRPNSGIYHDLDAHRDMINEEIRNHNYFK